MSVLIPTMIGKHHLKLDMPGEFSNKVLQKCLTTTKEPPEPLLDEIAELVMKDKSFWEGSATELVSLIKVEIQPHVITRKLNVLSGRLYAEHGIYYKNNRTHDGRKIRFWKDDTETA